MKWEERTVSLKTGSGEGSKITHLLQLDLHLVFLLLELAGNRDIRAFILSAVCKPSVRVNPGYHVPSRRKREESERERKKREITHLPAMAKQRRG